MQRFFTFTLMRLGIHPARAGFYAMFAPWLLLGVIIVCAIFTS